MSNGIWNVIVEPTIEEDIYVMVSCGRGHFKGESRKDTELRFKNLMIDNGFEIDEFGFLLNADFEIFKTVMRKAGWVREFIAIGP